MRYHKFRIRASTIMDRRKIVWLKHTVQIRTGCVLWNTLWNRLPTPAVKRKHKDSLDPSGTDWSDTCGLRRTGTDELSPSQERSVMELEHIGVYRLYDCALNLEMFNENDLHHLDRCTECL